VLAFGHAGITLGAAVLLSGLATRGNRSAPPPAASGIRTALPPPGWRRLTASAAALLDRMSRRVDPRALLVGSLVPDIIDKPLGHLFFRDAFSSGRIFGHTLLFLIGLGLAGLFLRRRAGRTWLLALAFGTATHLLFDAMWQNPRTLWWPIMGLTFERGDLTDWIPGMLRALTRDPTVFLPEIAGGMVLAALALLLLRRKMVRSFLGHGRVGHTA
jgi:inner membrane protein